MQKRLPRNVHSSLNNVLILGLLFTALFFRFKEAENEPMLVSSDSITALLNVEKVMSNGKTHRIFGKVLVFENAEGMFHSATKLLVFTKGNETSLIEENSRVWLYGKLEEINNSGGKLAFDWKTFYQRKGIDYCMYNPIIGRMGKAKVNPLNVAFRAQKIKDLLLNRVEESALSDLSKQVITAMLLGEKSGMKNEVKQAFSTSGVIHVLAVSGLHVGIVYLVIRFICSLIGLTKKNGFFYALILISSIWAFALVTGLSSSVVRAAFMFSLMIFSEVFQRRSSIYNTIACSAFFILLFNPQRLFDLGFQLSYSAVLGIIAIYPILTCCIEAKNRLLNRLIQMMAVSVAAQLATLPLVLYHFGNFPVYFLLGNLVAIPMTSLIIVLALLYITSLIIFGGNVIIDLQIKILDVIISWFYRYITKVSELPYSQKEIQFDDISLVFTLFLILLLVVSIYKAKKAYLWVGMILFALIVVFRTVDQLNQQNTTKGFLLLLDNNFFLGQFQNEQHDLLALENTGNNQVEYALDRFRRAERLPLSMPIKKLVIGNASLVKIVVQGATKNYLIIHNLSAFLNEKSLNAFEKTDAVVLLQEPSIKSLSALLDGITCPIYKKRSRYFNKNVTYLRAIGSRIIEMQNQDYVCLPN